MLEPVPLLMTPGVRRWRCKLRGACCKIHKIEVEPIEQRRIARALREAGDPRAALMEAALPEVGGVPHLPMVRTSVAADDRVFEERCVFLGADNLCQLRPLGRERPVYPGVCQKFPYLSVLTPEHHVFDLTLQCPTALELFASEGAFELAREPEDAEPPCDALVWLGQDDREYRLVDGTTTDGRTFWRTHWEWLERFRSRPESNPVARLTAFAEDVTGQEAPPVAMMSKQLWVQAAFESSLPRQLERLSGVRPMGLDYLWVHLPRDPAPEPPVVDTDEDGLLMRYLLHRFVVSPIYMYRTDHQLLLASLFATCCRYRIERARGVSPILAIRELDRTFVHLSGAGASIAPQGHASWRPLCSLANASTV